MNGIRSYALVTGAYWGFTLDRWGAPMLVVLHFYKLGYSGIAIAFLFLFYEVLWASSRTCSGDGLHPALD